MKPKKPNGFEENQLDAKKPDNDNEDEEDNEDDKIEAKKVEKTKDNEEKVLEQINSIAENIISKNLEEKKKIFIVDKSMQRIVEISNQTYEIASKKLKNKDIEIDFNISDRVKELKELLEAVKPYNKEQAKKLISETVADLHFIEHPDTEFYSFRLSNLKKEEEQR